MTLPNVRNQRLFVLTASLLIVAWGAFGIYQGLQAGFSGGLYDPEYRVPGVPPGGVADRAGLKAGDRVISVEGRPVEELGMESRWPRSLRPRAGESRRFVIERGVERLSLDVVFPAPFLDAVKNRIRAALLGLGFLVCGLWGFLTVETPHARTVAMIGLAAGLGVSLGLGPHFGGVWSGVQDHAGTAVEMLMFILVLRFFLEFPAAKRMSSSRVVRWIVYGAWACVIAFLGVEIAVHPALYYTTGNVTGPFILVCVLLSFTAIAHTVIKGPRALLRDSGMNCILGGLLLLAAAFVVSFTFSIRMPLWVEVLLLLVFPLSLALAVRTQARQALQ